MSYIDIFPTLMEVAGVKKSKKHLDGESVWSYWSGKKAERKDWLFYSYYDGKDIQHHKPNPANKIHNEYDAVIQGKWKLNRYGPIVLKTDDLKAYSAIDLFNIIKDPNEKINIASAYPGVVNLLLQKILEFRRLQPKNIKPVSLYAPPDWVAPKILGDEEKH